MLHHTRSSTGNAFLFLRFCSHTLTQRGHVLGRFILRRGEGTLFEYTKAILITGELAVLSPWPCMVGISGCCWQQYKNWGEHMCPLHSVIGINQGHQQHIHKLIRKTPGQGWYCQGRQQRLDLLTPAFGWQTQFQKASWVWKTNVFGGGYAETQGDRHGLWDKKLEKAVIAVTLVTLVIFLQLWWINGLCNKCCVTYLM